MNSVAFLHYHLKAGGVSQVICSQIESLKDLPCIKECYIISGMSPDKDFSLRERVVVDCSVQYLNRTVTKDEALCIRDRLYTFFKKTVTPGTIIHAHNSALGKNPVLTFVLYMLINEGYRIVLQYNDFAEDRPENMLFLEQIINGYFSTDLLTVMYPDVENCCYNTINTADYNRLLNMKIFHSKILFLPNPVGFYGRQNSRESMISKYEVYKTLGLSTTKPLFIYPVRLIERKNPGEFILLAALFWQRAHWLITLAPDNPLQKKIYEQWKKFSTSIDIPVQFNAGDRIDFFSLMYAADRIVTTSRQEGFGMAFLEPWLFDKPVCGRDIPSVTSDFTNNGMRFEHLYKRLIINTESGKRDFALLSQNEQEYYIRRLLHNKSEQEALVMENRLEYILFDSVSGQLIQKNRETVENRYSIKKYGVELSQVYNNFRTRQTLL